MKIIKLIWCLKQQFILTFSVSKGFFRKIIFEFVCYDTFRHESIKLGFLFYKERGPFHGIFDGYLVNYI